MTQTTRPVRNRLIGIVGAAVLVFLMAPLPARTEPEPERGTVIATTLAVQTAMQRGRDHLLQGDSKAAVYVLESQLDRINGNPAYLALLRDAYRAYVKQLKLANQQAELKIYLQRLQILDPGVALDPQFKLDPDTPASVPAASAPLTQDAKSQRLVRGQHPDEETAPDGGKIKTPTPVTNQLQNAEEAFARKSYAQAAQFFAQAQAETTLSDSSRERWAYCIFHEVVTQLNQPQVSENVLGELDKKVRQALQLTTQEKSQQYGQYLLGEIQKRRAAPPSTDARKNADTSEAIAVRHAPRGQGQWAVAETVNFRVFHNQSAPFAEQVARMAEQTRLAVYHKWLTPPTGNWHPRCDIYLHATAQDYHRATGAPLDSPGHSSVRSEANRVVGRRVDLRHDAELLLSSTLPHEITHVVLADQFDKPLPRWADEGMAMLAESSDRVERLTRQLPKCRAEKALFPVRQLLEMADYPDSRYITPFYAQSVSLVDFLVSQRDPQVFTQFVRDGQRRGFELALREHYGYQTYDDLQRAWDQKVFSASATARGKP
ncbi:MAG: hypothetical protein ACK4RK_03145 [Gemmataceae bacterium]